MKKKMLAVLLAACMAAGCLAGCGQTETGGSTVKESESTQQQESSPETTSSVVEEKEEEIATVTWAWRGDPNDDDEQVVEAMNELLRERYNLELNLIAITSGDYNQRMQLMSTSNEDYDICFTSNWANKFSDNVAREALLPLNDLLESEAAADLMAVYPEGLTDVATVNGTIYALPNYQLIYTQVSAYVQKDLAEKYNLDTEAEYGSIVDLEPFMQQILENEEGIWPLCESNMMGSSFGEWNRRDGYNNLVVEHDDVDYTVQYYLENEGVLNSLKKTNEYYQKGYIRNDVATVTDNTSDLAAGKYAIICATGKPGGEVDYSNEYGEEYIQIPLGDPYLATNAGSSTMLGINVNSKNPEAAMKMISVMWTDVEIFNMFLYGLEGEHYTKVSENRIELIEDSGYDSRDGWACGNQFNAWLLPGMDDNVWVETEAINRSAEPSHLMGFTFDKTALQTEIAQMSTVTAELGREYMWTDDFEGWREEYQTKLKAAGLDTVKAELEKQIADWRAANGK